MKSFRQRYGFLAVHLVGLFVLSAFGQQGDSGQITGKHIIAQLLVPCNAP